MTSPADIRGLIIVPALNEARNLPGVLCALRDACPNYDVCVVDDGSNDETTLVATGAGATVLRHTVNLGIGGAVQAGYLWARDRGYQVAVQVDGDGQHDPSYIPDSVHPITEGRADLVIGSRFLVDGGYRSTPIRRAGIRYLAWLLKICCGAQITDPTSGFRATGRKGIELFATWYPSDYPEPEAVAFAIRNGLRLLEVPVRMQVRGHGQSSIDIWRSLYYLVKVSLALTLLPTRLPTASGQAAGEERSP